MFKKKELTRLGDILVSKGLITSAQLDLAIQEQVKRKKLLDPSDPQAQVAPIGEILIELGFIDRLQLKRGLNWQQHLRRASIAMALCAPFMIFSPSAAAATVRPAPTTIQAENYTAMSGVFNENTADVGGGQNTGNIGTGDWMTYNNVVIPATGDYIMTYRVASLSAGGSFVLSDTLTNTTLDTVTVPVTGGWQTWVDVKTSVKLKAGTVNLKLLATLGGFNVNWFKIEDNNGTVVASSSAAVSSAAAVSSSAAVSSAAAVSSSAAVSSAAATTSSAATSSVAPSNFPFIIQAENYATMSGVWNETTSDVGGGQNTGNINTGDWMSYTNTKVSLPWTGKYKITYRVASLNGGGVLALSEAGTTTTHHAVSIPKTGGWQTWVDVVAEVDLTQGDHYFKVLGQVGGFNVNWFKIEPIGTSMPLTIQAENYSAMSGVWNENTSDVGGGQNTGNINTGDWMDYKNVEVLIPVSARYKVTYRVASLNGGGQFTMHEAGTSTIFDTVTVPLTGGWQKWINVEKIITIPAGKHYFGVKALVGGFNVNWFKFEPVDANGNVIGSSSTSSSTATVVSSSSSSAPAVSSASSSSQPAVTSSSSWSSASSTGTTGSYHLSGPVGISWTAPSMRENGTYLDITELGGYEIRYKKLTDTRYTYVSIADAWTMRYDFPYLAEGDYVFQIAAFDKNGVYSPFVDIQRQ